MKAMVEPLPLVPGHVDRRRQAALGMAELGQQPLDAPERQIDGLRMQREKARDQRIGGIHAARSFCMIRQAESDAHARRATESRRPRRRLGEEPRQARDGRLQVVAMHHHVDHAVILQVLGALEAVGQLLADGLLDHPRPGKADQRAGLGEMHVAEHGVGRRDAAGRRIGEHDDIGQFRARAAGESRPSCAASA